MKAGFVEKLIGRLGKIGPEDVQNYFLRLAEEKGFLETVFNSIQEGIIVTDAKGRITYLNDAACQLFGLEAEESIGKRLDERVRGLDWSALSRSEGPISRDMEIFYPSNRFINFYSVPLVIERAANASSINIDKIDISGEQVGHAIILRDITESRRTEQQTIESERLNALTLLAAGVAHEIGNPLNSLNIHLQLIEREARKLDGTKGAELQESVEVARAEINRLDSIISQFLRAIRPTRPQLPPENINAIVEEAVRFLAPAIKNRDIVVEQELRSHLPLLELDRDQIKQAFYNVIKNSFEAMKSRGILRIRTDMDESHVIVRFTDTGGGISAENLSRVFEPYFTTKTSGTGLGLLIVRRIVREHGGEFSIEQKLWGDPVLGYHLINIFLHGFAAIVLLQILLRLKVPGAWLAAGLFALHPIQVESVAWISEIKNTLSGLFFFCSILAYLNFDQNRSRVAYFGSLALFLFGLMCKTAIAPLPAIILAVLWWRRGRLRLRDDVVPSLPFFGLGIGAGLFTAWVERNFVGAHGTVFQLSILQRCLIAARDFWFYLFKLLWPVKLTFIYPRWQISSAVWWQYLFPLALILLLAVLWQLRKNFRAPLAAALVFLGLLFPALGFINVYPFIYSFVADHFQYLACFGPLTFVVAGIMMAVDSAVSE